MARRIAARSLGTWRVQPSKYGEVVSVRRMPSVDPMGFSPRAATATSRVSGK